jgi:hypothetical protein
MTNAGNVYEFFKKSLISSYFSTNWKKNMLIAQNIIHLINITDRSIVKFGGRE